MQINLTTLLGIQGYRISGLAVEERKKRRVIVIDLKRSKHTFECGICGRKLKKAHSNWDIEVKHLPLWEYSTILRLKRYRVNCPGCGINMERLPFIADEGRVTRSMAVVVFELCKVMTHKAVGLFMNVHRETVKRIDKKALEKLQATRLLDGITVLGADEVSIGKGQNYLTLLSAMEGPRGPEMLYVTEGRRERDLKRFWRWFGKQRACRITHAALDMWKPFRNSFKTHCPNVQIIYDKFHVIRHLLEALNKVRKAELRRAAKRFRHVLAGKKFILLSRQAHVRGRARQALNQILQANRRLFKAHMLKESFGHLWSYRSKTWARKFFNGWVAQLKWSRLKPYHRFARMVEKHLDGILAYCDKHISLGYLEATNLKVRNLIRRAYGYRDDEYMKLKIIQVCTPWMGEFKPWAWAHKIPS
jgi:transposase